MSKVTKASTASKGSKASKALMQNIELQITQIGSKDDINSENVLHDVDVNGNSSETKKQKKTAAKLSKLKFGGGGGLGGGGEKAEEKLAEVGTDEEWNSNSLLPTGKVKIHCRM
jgi:hypothetical protein